MPTHKIFAAFFTSVFLTACTAQPEPDPKTNPFEPGTVVDFTFPSNGLELSGIFETPDGEPANALILFIHGYGETDVRGRNSFSDLRTKFAEIGVASAVWDKPGQGESEGKFDSNQSVNESAQEVLDAAQKLRAMNAPGASNIGLWGISRAGWIAPIAMEQDPDLNFWISVSGVTGEDNFPYLLLSNLPYEGGSEESAAQLSAEWQEGCAIQRSGGSYQAYLDATETLRANEYILGMRGPWLTHAQYEGQQTSCANGSCEGIDDRFCSYIFIPEFDQMLSGLEADVLAIFGAKDLNVDWRLTRSLYEATIGINPKASLAMQTFLDADHNLHIAETGSIQEMMIMSAPQKSDGYYDLQVSWLLENVLQDTESDARE